MTPSLGAELAAELPELRALAESLMLDTARVDEITGVTTDPLTGASTSTYATVYGPDIAPLPGKRSGMCKVQGLDPQEANPEAGGATLTVQRYAIHVPVGAFVPKVGHVVTITATALDPNLVGHQYRVVALLHKTLATAYRLSVEEVS